MPSKTTYHFLDDRSNFSAEQGWKDAQAWSRHQAETNQLYEAFQQYRDESVLVVGDNMTCDALFRKLYGYHQYDYPNYHPNFEFSSK